MQEARSLAGEPVARAIRADAARRARDLRERGVTPTLALLSVGEDPASRVYLARKQADGEAAGLAIRARAFPAHAPHRAVFDALAELGRDPTVHGVLLQMPLPPGWPSEELILALPPAKDVDGFHPENAGRLALGLPGFIPCTPRGILALLAHYDVPLAGRRVVVVGRSAIVGRPVATLLSQKGVDATVTLAHSRTRDLPVVCREAEVLVVAMGVPRAIGAEHVRPGAVVVDVGIHREPDPARPGSTRLVGDVDAEAVRAVAGALSPVPGGVGPLTVAFLLANTVAAAERATHAGVPSPRR